MEDEAIAHLDRMYGRLVNRYEENPENEHLVEVRRILVDLRRKKREKSSVVSMPKQDRYKVEGTDEDYVDITYRQYPFERFIGAMQWTIGKYFDRFGKKDDIVAEAYKIKDYANRFYEKVVLEAAKRKEK